MRNKNALDRLRSRVKDTSERTTDPEPVQEELSLIEKARQEYRTGGDREKALLEYLFGQENLESIQDRVKSYSDACRILGIPDITLQSDKPDLESPVVAFQMLITISEALNEGWTRNGEDLGYLPASLGSAKTYPDSLVLKSQELADYSGSQFERLWKIWLKGKRKN